jgi:hypothetical protein
MTNFVRGECTAKGVRHMERRLCYTCEKDFQGKVKLEYLAGIDTPANRLTKLGAAEEHIRYMTDILGLNLLGLNHYPLIKMTPVSYLA